MSKTTTRKTTTRKTTTRKNTTRKTACNTTREVAREGSIRILAVGESRRIVASGPGQVARLGSYKVPVDFVDLSSGATVGSIDGAKGYVLALAGNLAITGDKTLASWDRVSGKKVTSFKGHGKEVRSADVSPDGQWLATGSYDTTLRVWRIADGEQLLKVPHAKRNVLGVRFAPDGASIYTTADDGLLRCFAVADGAQRFEVKVDPQAPFGDPRLAVATGDLLATAEDITEGHIHGGVAVRLWRGAERLAELPLTDGANVLVPALAFSLDGKLVAAAVWRNWNFTTGKLMAVEWWDVGSGRHVRRDVLEGTDRIYDVAFADGATLVAATDQGLALLPVPR